MMDNKSFVSFELCSELIFGVSCPEKMQKKIPARTESSEDYDLNNKPNYSLVAKSSSSITFFKLCLGIAPLAIIGVPSVGIKRMEGIL